MYTLLLWLLSAAAEPFPPGFHDRPGVAEDGTAVVIRTGLWDDFKGGKAAVEQVLIPNEDGSFTYQYERQSRLTRMYHATYCGYENMHPGEGDAVFSVPGTYGGWHCSRETVARPSMELDHLTDPPI